MKFIDWEMGPDGEPEITAVIDITPAQLEMLEETNVNVIEDLPGCEGDTQ